MATLINTQEIIGCRKCVLGESRQNPVVGEGDEKADVMFIGEAPGKTEDEQGRPFCGRAGRVLDELLSGIGLQRDNVYITNILKCRPPGNRNPKEEEIKSCTPYLDKQVKSIKPKIICSLGNFATAYVLAKCGLKDEIKGISKIRAKVFSCNAAFGRLKIIPLYHPAVVTYNPNMKDTLQGDFAVLKAAMA